MVADPYEQDAALPRQFGVQGVWFNPTQPNPTQPNASTGRQILTGVTGRALGAVLCLSEECRLSTETDIAPPRGRVDAVPHGLWATQPLKVNAQ